LPLASGATYMRREAAGTGHADAATGPTSPFFILLIGNDSRPGVGGSRGGALSTSSGSTRSSQGDHARHPATRPLERRQDQRGHATGGAAQADAVGGLVGVHVNYGRPRLRRVHIASSTQSAASR
jgi:hypothetical protein